MNTPLRHGSRKKVLLVFPREPGSIVSNDAAFPFPLLGLTQLAAAFPADYDLRIVDETVSHLKGNEDVDLVCITTLTSTVKRAYFLADNFLRRGIPVILGGVHATVMPEEAGQHATSVVIGEAENMMPQIIADFEKGALAAVYRSGALIDLDHIASPRGELLSWRHRLFLGALQTSRGCPQSCDFCSVPAIFGRRLRLKTLATIEKELEDYKKQGARYLFVVDDNFTVNRERARAIMDLFKFYRFRWMGFSNLSVAEDGDFLQALSDSNCVSLFIGFESLHQQDLFRKNRRYADVKAVSDAIGLIHEAGIGIQGSFIFGFDQDTPEVFREVTSFIQENGIEVPNVNILTPFPGTELYENMVKEGRIRHQDWDLYDMNHVVYEPKGMTAEQLQQGYAWTLKYLSSPTSILKRLSMRRQHYVYFMIANFSLHRSQTLLAKHLWNRSVQKSLRQEGAY